MLIARITKEDGTELFLLGLSHENVARLLNGEPIHIRRKTHGEGVPAGWEIALMVGESERTMRTELEKIGAVTPQTMVHIDPRLA